MIAQLKTRPYLWYGYGHQSSYDLTSYAQITLTERKITSNYERQQPLSSFLSVLCEEVG